MNVGRREILEGNWKYRKDLIPLIFSLHAKKRMEERVEGQFMVVPTMARITKENICSGQAIGDKLRAVKIRLDYSRHNWMFLVICPSSGVVKTLYIDGKKKAPKKEQNSEENKVSRTNRTGEAGRSKDEIILSGNMEKKSGWWSRTLRNIWRKIIRSKNNNVPSHHS